MSSNQGLERPQRVRWRAVWVLSPWVENPPELDAPMHAAGRRLGIAVASVSLEQRHVVVEFELGSQRDGEAAAALLKTGLAAHLGADGGVLRWWRDGIFVTRV